MLDAASGEEIAASRMPTLCRAMVLIRIMTLTGCGAFSEVLQLLPEIRASIISITTHGASAASLSRRGFAIWRCLSSIMNSTIRQKSVPPMPPSKPDFKDIAFPSLSLGLNLGAQLHFWKTTFPDDLRRHFIFTLSSILAWR